MQFAECCHLALSVRVWFRLALRSRVQKTDYYNGVVSNWKTDPVSAMAFMPACNSPWMKANVDSASLSYTNCDCSKAASGTNQTSYTGTCATVDTQRNCTTQTKSVAYDISDFWRGRDNFCLQRLANQNALLRIRMPGGTKTLAIFDQVCES